MILITGATGFVGKALCNSLAKRQPVRVSQRASIAANFPKGVEVFHGVLTSDENWSNALVGVDVVVHCAARVHVMRERVADPLLEFRRVNVEGTLNLAMQAAAAGVKRFIFLSSVKVNGESTTLGFPFSADQLPCPCDPYGVSKAEAESQLVSLAEKSGMEVVIVRPPLVYGPGVGANFQSLLRAITRGIPLPFGLVTGNRRSLVGIDNLVDLITTCLDHPAAANQTFLVSDGECLSTAALIRGLAEALNRPARLIPVPVVVLTAGAAFLGKANLAQRLVGSLELDIGKTRNMLGWTPPLSMSEGLQRTAEYWIRSQRRG